MKLYLIRHGDAVSAAVDPKRPLSRAGVQEVQRVARYLKEKGVKADHIFHSNKTRAQQTAQIIKEAINPKIQLVEKDYLAPNDSTDEITHEITLMNEDLMIVGHLPFLPSLAARLIIHDEGQCVINFRTGGLAVLEKSDSKPWQIIWSISPDMI